MFAFVFFCFRFCLFFCNYWFLRLSIIFNSLKEMYVYQYYRSKFVSHNLFHCNSQIWWWDTSVEWVGYTDTFVVASRNMSLMSKTKCLTSLTGVERYMRHLLIDPDCLHDETSIYLSIYVRPSACPAPAHLSTLHYLLVSLPSLSLYLSVCSPSLSALLITIDKCKQF